MSHPPSWPGLLIRSHCKHKNRGDEGNKTSFGKRGNRLSVISAHAYPDHQGKKQERRNKSRFDQLGKHLCKKDKHVVGETLENGEHRINKCMFHRYQKSKPHNVQSNAGLR